jgi:aspartate ammonia-lyase
MSKKLELRTELDALGEIQVPAQAHWGARTARWLEHLKQVEGRMQETVHPLLLDGLLQVFKAKLSVAREQLDKTSPVARVKAQVCDEILSGQWRDEIVVDPLLSPSGEALLDNLNEVVSGRTAEILGIDRKAVEAQTEIEFAQSLNLRGQDAYVAATKLALLVATRELSSALLDLERLLRRKSLEIEKAMRAAGMEEEQQLRSARDFNNFGNTAERVIRRLGEGRNHLLEVSFRGNRSVRERLIEELSLASGFKMKSGEEIIGNGLVNSSLADLLTVSSILKELATELSRVCQNLSRLTDLQNDSPAPAALQASCIRVIAGDLCVSLALQSASGDEGAPAVTLAANSLLQSIDQIRSAIRAFNQSCILNIQLAEKH